MIHVPVPENEPCAMIVRMVLRLPESAIEVVVVGVGASRDNVGHEILARRVEAVLVFDAECPHAERLLADKLTHTKPLSTPYIWATSHSQLESILERLPDCSSLNRRTQCDHNSGIPNTEAKQSTSVDPARSSPTAPLSIHGTNISSFPGVGKHRERPPY